MKTKQIIGVIVLLIIIAGGMAIIIRPPGEVVSPPAPKGDTDQCLTTIRGQVYNLTTWINQHPGGAESILSLCGKDGTQAFLNQHGGQGRPEQELKNFLVK